MNDRSLRPGDRAIVLRPLALVRPSEVEGWSRLLAPIPHTQGHWRVHFFGERLPRVRVVHGGVFQTHLEEIISALNDHHRAFADPTLLIDPINPFNLKR